MIFSKTLTEIIPSKNAKNAEIHPKTGYIKKKFLIMRTNYIMLKRSRKMLSNDNIFKNINLNHFIEKTQKP